MMVRVCLRHVGPNGDRWRFDLTLGPDLLPLADKVHFGFWGALDGVGDAFGVLLRPDGVLDLGSDWDSHNRFHKTNLLQRKMVPGEYVTVWWKWGTTHDEHTYVIEAVMQLSAVTDLVSLSEATTFLVPSLENLPRFRARVKRSFDIEGYDDVVYRPPVGVEGDIAIFQDEYVFAPDNAISKKGELITAVVDPDDLELIREW